MSRPVGFFESHRRKREPLGRGATNDRRHRQADFGARDRDDPAASRDRTQERWAIFESITAARDFIANYVVADGQIVTGQNQNSGAEVAPWLMELIEARQ